MSLRKPKRILVIFSDLDFARRIVVRLLDINESFDVAMYGEGTDMETLNLASRDLVIAGSSTRSIADTARNLGIMTTYIDDDKPPFGLFHITTQEATDGSTAFSNTIDLALDFVSNLARFPETKHLETPQNKIRAALGSDWRRWGTHGRAGLGRYVHYYYPSLDEYTRKLAAQHFHVEEEIPATT